MASGAEPADIAELFSESLDWKIAGDTGALPWIGQKWAGPLLRFIQDPVP